MDFSQYSDADLMKFASSPPIDLSHHSDDDLMKIAGINSNSPNPQSGEGFLAYKGRQFANSPAGETISQIGSGMMQGVHSLGNVYENLTGGQATGETPYLDKLRSAAKTYQEPNMNFSERLGAGLMGVRDNMQAKDIVGAVNDSIFGKDNPAGTVISTLNILPQNAAISTAIGNVNDLAEKTTGLPKEYSQLAETILPLTNKNITAKVSNDAMSLPEKTPLQSSKNIFADASNTYKIAELQGGVLKPDAVNAFIDNSSRILPQSGFGKAIDGETAPTQLVNRLQSLRDNPMSLNDAKEVDSLLSSKIFDEIDPITGKLSADGNKYAQIKSNLNDIINNSSPDDIVGGKEGFDSWNQARQLWSTASKIAEFEKIKKNASVAENPVTALKTGVRSLYKNEARSKGYNPEEISAIKNATQSGLLGGALNIASSRLLPIIAGSSGGGFGGAALGYALSELSRKGSEKIQTNRVNNVIKTISNRKILNEPIAKNIIEPPSAPNKNKLSLDQMNALVEALQGRN